MIYELRKAMGSRDSKYTMKRMIEFDEAYFSIGASEIEKEKGILGKGAAAKQNIAAIAEFTPLEDPDTGETPKHCKYFKHSKV